MTEEELKAIAKMCGEIQPRSLIRGTVPAEYAVPEEIDRPLTPEQEKALSLIGDGA